MIQSCPNCEQWLALVNNHYVHLNTTQAHACWTKWEVEAGIAYVPPVEVENPEVEVEDWVAFAFGTDEPEDVPVVEEVEESIDDLLALLG